MRRLGLALLLAAVGGPAAAQTWTGGAGSGSWAAGGNWTPAGTPASATTTAITLAGTTQTTTVQDITAAFSLNSLSMDVNSATAGFTVNPSASSRLVFGGTAPAITVTGVSGTASALTLNTDLEVGAAGLGIALNGPSGTGTFYEAIFGGRLLGTGTINRSNAGAVATDLVLRGAGGTFSGTFDTGGGAGGITILGAQDVFGRGVVLGTGNLLLGGVNLTISGASAQAGFATPAAFSQQVGTLTGAGQVVLSNAAVTTGAATLLTGFNNTDSTLSGGLSAPAPAGGATAHFGKVGTGVFTLGGASTTLVGGVSARDGTFVVSGGGTLGSTAASPTTALSLAVYGGTELRAVTGGASTNRLQNNAAVSLAGGTLRFDASGQGANATGLTEATGVLTLGPGQSTVRVDGAAGRGAALQFDSLTNTALGSVLFESASLGLTGVDTVAAGNVAFATVPLLVGTNSGYGINTTNLRILAAGTSGTPGAAAPASLVAYDTVTNSVRPLVATNYAVAFGAADDNVSLASATVLAAGQTANALRLTAGGAVSRGANALTLTSGALLSTGGGDVTGTGTLSFGAGGAATGYVTTTGPLLIDGPVQAANLAKGGAGTLTVGGAVALGNGGTVAVNAGTLTVAAAATVTTADGAATFRVSRGATLDVSAAGLTVGAQRTLTGAGTVLGAVTVTGTVANPGVVAPSALGGPTASGASPATLTVGNMAWQPNGSYRWFVNSVLGGTYSQSRLAGAAGATLDLSGLTSANRFTITPSSLALSNASGPVYDFDRTKSYTFTIASFPGGVTGFSADKFTVSVAEFQNSLQAGDTFTVQLSGGTDVQLVFAPVPEPATVLAVGAAAALLLRRRRPTAG